MIWSIIGLILTFISFVICNVIAWVILYFSVAPIWLVWVVGVINLLLGGIGFMCGNWIREELEYRSFLKRLWEEMENREI